MATKTKMATTAISKGDLIKIVAERAGLKQVDAQAAIDTFLEELAGGISNGGVTLKGFGSFTVVHRKARTMRSFGTTVEYKGGNVVKFKAGQDLKGLVNR